jgi:hypothetical protein
MRIRPAAAAKEKRLAALLAAAGREVSDPSLAGVVADAQLLGSLELAGIRATWEEVRSSRVASENEARGTGSGLCQIHSLRRAQRLVEPDAPLTLAGIRAWHQALRGPVGFRSTERQRAEAPPAPAGRIEPRLQALADWLAGSATRDLGPEQAAGLAYARIVEILPFEEANGRVARLAASHLMVQRGLPPPILVGADGPHLDACLRAAFRLETEPIVSLLLDASSRALDVMIQALERGEG